ncbi:MAG: undecaprenyl-diphosphatase, partial [Candidatus Marinimicrobia bacterium]|nr:undecaprenyl-diphosphatase [Candidatus Neomarinimicrobiota bacterium]
MTLIEATILGIVQGFTEFLPISSSGHLVLGQAILGIEQPGNEFEILVHLGTLASV